MTRHIQRQRIVSPLGVGLLVILSLVIFWNLLGTYEGGEYEETPENYTETVEALVNTTLWIDKGEYATLEFEAFRGDNLNVTVQVLDGGPVDYFLMEQEKKELFEGWIEGTKYRFYTDDNGKGLNVTDSENMFIAQVTGKWYVVLNNMGRMLDGAIPVDEVHIKVLVVRTGHTVAQSFG